MYPKLKPIAAAITLLTVTPPVFAADKEFDPIVVTATRQASRVSELLSDVTVIGREEIEKAGAVSLGELLAGQPGVQVAQSGMGMGKATSIYIRGGNGGHALMLVDGMRIGSSTLGASTPELIPLSQIERIEIVRGAASALYGSDALSGVIQIFTKKHQGQQAQPEIYLGGGSYGAHTANVGFSSGTDVMSYSLRGGYSAAEGISARNKSVAFNDRDGYKNSNMSGNLKFMPAKGHEFGLSVLQSDVRSWFDDEYSTAPGNIRNNSYQTVVGLYTKNRLLDSWTSTLRFNESSNSNNNIYSTSNPETHYKTIQNQLTWQNDIRLPIGRALIAFENLDERIDTDKNYAKKSRSTRSWLVGWQGQFGRHGLQLNTRVDSTSLLGDKQTETLAYGYQLSEQWRVQTSVGTGFKAPSFNGNYWPYESNTYTSWCPGGAPSCTYITQGNINLKPEESRNQEVSLRWDAGHSTASATYFKNDIKNLIDWQNTSPAANTFVYMPNNVANAKIEGLTLAGTTYFGSFKLSGSIDWLKARDGLTGYHLQNRANQAAFFRIENTLYGADVGTEIQAAGSRFTKDSNRDEVGGFTLFNAYVRKSISKEWGLEGRINNVFNKQYELVKNFNTPGTNFFVGLRYTPQ